MFGNTGHVMLDSNQVMRTYCEISLIIRILRIAHRLLSYHRISFARKNILKVKVQGVLHQIKFFMNQKRLTFTLQISRHFKKLNFFPSDLQM